MDFQRYRGGQAFAARQCRPGQEGVIGGMQQQGRRAYRGEQRPGAAARVIVVGAEEAVQRRGDGIVEVAQGARGFRAVQVEAAGKSSRLCSCRRDQGAQEMPRID